jgi:hypothetical protein
MLFSAKPAFALSLPLFTDPACEAAPLSRLCFSPTCHDSATRQERLRTLEPLKIQYFVHNGKPHYWFADPYSCHCVYVGNQENYARLKIKQKEYAEVLHQQIAEREYMQFMSLPPNEIFYGAP